MRLRFHFWNRLIPAATSFGFLAFLAVNHSIQAQTAVSEHVVVTDEEVPSAYGAPPSFSRSRFANLTNAYVLPPWAVYTGLIYEGDALRFNSPDHTFTQEIEIGLPYRFGVAMENSVERFRGYTQDRSFSLEVRYALADWNKIPLNPTLFAEYKFGLGNILHDEGPPAPLGPGEALAFINEHNPLPDAYELRLLLSQDFCEKIEWALNAFFEQEIGGDRGREYGFAQSAVVPVLLPREQLKVGVEMQLTTFTDAGSRGRTLRIALSSDLRSLGNRPRTLDWISRRSSEQLTMRREQRFLSFFQCSSARLEHTRPNKEKRQPQRAIGKSAPSSTG